MPDKVTPEQIKEALKANDINSIEDLAKLLADDQNSIPGSISKIDELGKSWVIKVWKLDRRLEDLDVRELPSNLGGNLLE